jgi:hypothetical protein
MVQFFPIGIGGVAGCGKDTLARILRSKLKNLGYSCYIDHFAAPLKENADDFLYRNFGVSAFTTDRNEKESIRPFLVGLAEVYRKRTSGRFFWKNLIKRNDHLIYTDILIVPDLRFAEYKQDEIDLFNTYGMSIYLEMAGKLAGNEIEEKNDSIMKGRCRSIFFWKKCEDPHIKYAPQINNVVENILKCERARFNRD